MEAWKLGGVSRVGTVTYDSARYVADYIGKGQDDKSQKEKEELYGIRNKPFKIMSQGLGRGYCDLVKEQLMENMRVTVRGKDVGLPRYYVRRLKIDTKSKIMREPDPMAKEVASSKISHVWIGNAPMVVHQAMLPRRQREKEAVARENLTKKGKG
jgi:hypothetical protein